MRANKFTILDEDENTALLTLGNKDGTYPGYNKNFIRFIIDTDNSKEIININADNVVINNIDFITKINNIEKSIKDMDTMLKDINRRLIEVCNAPDMPYLETKNKCNKRRRK